MSALIVSLTAALAAIVYTIGLARMRRRWPLWRTAAFFLGLVALLATLASPIDSYATVSFAVHMVQHMLLTVVAAPLLMLGAPIRPLLRGLPTWVRAAVVRPLARARPIRTLLHLVRHPLVAAAVYVGGLYAWHLPSLYDAALLDARVHVIEHAWFFFSALVFWSVVIDPEPFRATLGYGARLPYLLVLGAAQNTVLGGILSFSSRLLYTAYTAIPDPTVFDLDRVTDQRVGGAIMWVVGDFVFLAAASVAFFLWLAEEEETQRRRERIASR
ncbi:MAG: cytochrome c oxidase assembly protein [Chloroflexota bacterium]|nr:cytochrome c oxidase assembly protein [Chloroflexota bacterium]